MPWYAEYRRLYIKQFNISEHDTFNHPVACVIAISSQNPDPFNTLQQLHNLAASAPIYDKGFIDSNILRYYVLLHDNQNGNITESEQLFDKMRKTFGVHCHLLRINSVIPDATPTSDGQVVPDIWKSDAEDLSITAVPQQADGESKALVRGCCLTFEDFYLIQNFVKEMVVQSIIPYMERSIHHWNEQVASIRRGFTGRLFSASRKYFGSSNKPSGIIQSPQIRGSGISGVMYHHSAPEAQMRRLADFAFMLRDYKFALSVYDTVKKDYSTDKAWKYFAGAYEMMGLCSLMMENINTKNDIESNYEQAISNYLKVGSPELGARTAIFYYEMLRYRGMYKDIPSVLIRMSGDDSDLRSGLFLEQAAHSFLRGFRPKVRKYGAHLVLAGSRYIKAEQHELAFHCYRAASLVFETKNWSLVENHIHFALGCQNVRKHCLQAAVEYFLKLLRESRQSTALQTNYLTEFLNIYQQYVQETGQLPELLPYGGLPIPIVDNSSVKVMLSSSQSLEHDGGDWESVEQDYFLEEPYIQDKSTRHGQTVCALGGMCWMRDSAVAGKPNRDFLEPVTISFVLTNPMQVPIVISNISLKCVYSEQEFQTSCESYDSTPPADEEPLDYMESGQVGDINMEGDEQKMITVAITPKKQGYIRIAGVHYTLNHVARGFKQFSKKGKRLNDTKEHRLGKFYGQDNSLDMVVTSPMPLLDVEFRDFPNILFSGEVIQSTLIVRNIGQKGMKKINVKVSHPAFFHIGQPSAESTEDTSACKDSLHTVDTNNSLFDPSVISISLTQLGSGEAVEVPIWVRGDKIGSHSFLYIFSYQSEEVTGANSIRYLRYQNTTQVIPSLKINAFTRQSTLRLNEFILGLEAENVQTGTQFELLQLSSMSPYWKIQPISSDRELPTETVIGPKQTTLTYFRIKQLSPEELSTKERMSPELFTLNGLESLLINQKIESAAPLTDLTYVDIPLVSDYRWQ
ncbi:hypothetical protein K493DRAFT_204561 [Basidiobolus meristosporus CBS 931.73]|uniref:Trafficking protein particle complex subunit 8 n=1 Tax=Basidiobolus meristosporus CBS 931.73 TaxID=1314790 RepID=A0A1Y1Z4Y5_9FUNG|nr:hypothetical protein K493DRAFT_204561 [Basidiobolus meristosporus CBS 931.73]|eukprot:ORY05323.1 hypothetical protein K493DRAFT_204561 [Basidiobolus meristosporus CBS 931.73]